MQRLVDDFDCANVPVLSFVGVTGINNHSVEVNLFVGASLGVMELGVVHFAPLVSVLGVLQGRVGISSKHGKCALLNL